MNNASLMKWVKRWLEMRSVNGNPITNVKIEIRELPHGIMYQYSVDITLVCDAKYLDIYKEIRGALKLFNCPAEYCFHLLIHYNDGLTVGYVNIDTNAKDNLTMGEEITKEELNGGITIK